MLRTPGRGTLPPSPVTWTPPVMLRLHFPRHFVRVAFLDQPRTQTPVVLPLPACCVSLIPRPLPQWFICDFYFYRRNCVTPTFCFPYALILTAGLSKQITGSLRKVRRQNTYRAECALEFSRRTAPRLCAGRGPVLLKPERTPAFGLPVGTKPNQQ